MKKKQSKNTQDDSPRTDTICGCNLSSRLTIPPTTIGITQKKLSRENFIRTQLLHDMKRIAIAINQLVRDLDRIENGNSVDNSIIGSIPLGVER